MQAFPHHYRAQAEGTSTGTVRVSTDAAPTLETHAPPEFDGPGGYWSPEALLVAAVADCYILSFRAVARASKLDWRSLSVEVEGILDRVGGITRFVGFTVSPRLSICSADGEHLAGAVLDKAERACLVTNSLNAPCTLQPQVSVGPCNDAVTAT
jgi:organic hydroperoxide reductase OsmC/OhrA